MFIFNKASLLIFAIVLIGLTACQTNEKTPATPNTNYTISGKIDTLIPDGTAILSLFNPITQVKNPLDTAIIGTDGSYALNFKFSEPDLFRVDFQKKQ